MTGMGRVLFAVGFGVLGAFTIGWPGFVLEWLPLPNGVAWLDLVAILSGTILVALSLALLVPRTARLTALAFAAFLLVPLLAKMPNVAAHPLVEGVWEDISENLIYIAGAWTIFSLLPRGDSAFANFGNVRAGQILFGLALPTIGLSHIIYLNLTAPLIPSWIPFHVPLAYFTGGAHMAVGLAILCGVLPRLAATLEAIMVSLFTLLVWIPTVIATPTNRFHWSEICVSTAISGAAWAIAESYRGRPWGLKQGD